MHTRIRSIYPPTESSWKHCEKIYCFDTEVTCARHRWLPVACLRQMFMGTYLKIVLYRLLFSSILVVVRGYTWVLILIVQCNTNSSIFNIFRVIDKNFNCSQWFIVIWIILIIDKALLHHRIRRFSCFSTNVIKITFVKNNIQS